MLEDVSPATGNRVVCYCDDCQAFARFLEQPDVLDALGGTDIYQVAPARMRITAGEDALACVRLSEKGLYRWYAGCCRTPIGNTIPRAPFVGVIHVFMDHAGDGRSRDEVLGPPVGFVHGRFAIGGQPAHAPRKATVGLVARSARLLLGWWARGLGTPSPFFDAKTRAPRVPPRVLTKDERDALGA